jgi:CelD/BcsL family acetyltransferase involved in cellulose biosynthesis
MNAEMIMTHAGSDLVLSLLTPEDALADPLLLADWRAKLARVNQANRLYASPEWFENRWRAFPDTEMRLGVLSSRRGELLGVCPLAIKRVSMRYYIARRIFAETRFSAAVVLSGEPLIPRSSALFARLFDGIFEQLPRCECICFEAIPTESLAWEYLRVEGRRSRRYLSYLSRGEVREWRLIDLMGGFDKYLSGMKGKARYKLRKRVRDLQEHGCGRLVCRRVDAIDQVEAFVESASKVKEKSWKHHKLGAWPGIDSALTCPELQGLARAGILRAYTLECGSEPCAYLVGYQYDEVFYSAETGFDETFIQFAPGMVLHYLVLEDLFAHDTPELFNFGIGDMEYKRHFSNRVSHDATMYLFRRTLANRLRHTSHLVFHSGVRLAKRLLKVERLRGALRG